jgi:hypothetical protein
LKCLDLRLNSKLKPARTIQYKSTTHERAYHTKHLKTKKLRNKNICPAAKNACKKERLYCRPGE